MTNEPLSRRVPSGAKAVLSAERADLLLSGIDRLLDSMPLPASGPLRAALATLSTTAGLGGSVLDPHTFQKRGVALDRGAAIWALRDGSFTALFQATSPRLALERLGELLGGGKEPLIHRDEYSVAPGDKGETKLLFGTFPPFVWVWLGDLGEEAAFAEVKAAWNAPDDPRASPLMKALLPAPSSLTAYLTEVEHEGGVSPLVVSLSVAPRELRLEAVMLAHPRAREVFSVVCGRSPPDLGRSMPRGALALLSGLDLGEAVEGSRLQKAQASGREPGAPSPPAPRGVAAIAIHQIDPGASALVRAGASLDALLSSGTVHGSMVMRVEDVARWKEVTREEVASEGGRVEPDGVMLLPVDKNKADSAVIRIAFERDTFVAALGEDDLREARRAARSAVAGASSDVGDREARALLEKGEPLVYVKVAALLERIEGALLERLWRQGERAGSLGAGQIIKWLKAIEDATLHVDVHHPDVFRGWLKIRLSP